MTCSKCGQLFAGNACPSCQAANNIENSHPFDGKGILTLLFASLVAFLNCLEPSLFGGVRWEITLSMWFLAMSFAILAAYLLKGRRGDWKGARQLLIVVVFAGTLPLTLQRMKDRETPEQRMSRLMREAAGLQAPKSHDREEAAVRGIFSDMLNSAKRASEHRTRLDLSELYQSSSFESADRMQGEITKLDAVLQQNTEAQSFYTHVPEMIDKRLVEAGVSESRRAKFAEHTKRLFASGVPAAAVFQAEQEWAQDTKSLYEFALAHSDAIIVRDQQLQVTGDGTLAEFNRLWDASLASRTRLQEANDANMAALRNASARFQIQPEEIVGSR
jgi:hypothetical protein